MRPARRHAALATLVALAVAGTVALSPQRAIQALQRVLASPWFPLVLIALYAIRPFLAWPITAISLLVGYQYGLLLGLPIALTGAAATSLIPYAATRYADTSTGLLGLATDGSTWFFATVGDLRGLIAARLAPTPAEPVSAAAGAAGLSTPTFILGTLIGELPWTIAAVLAGHTTRQLSLDAATPDPWLITAGLLAALILLAGPAYHHLQTDNPPG